MSYILNALRKSERERQAIEPDTVTARIITHQPPRHQSSSRLMAALIVINLAILVYFLGFTEKTPPAVTQPEASVVKPEASRAEIMPPEPKVPSIAEIVEARAAAPATAAPDRPVVVKKQPIEPIEPVKPVRAPPQPVIQQVEPATPLPVKLPAVAKQPVEPVKPTLAPPQPVIQQAEPAKDAIKNPVQAPAPLTESAPAPAAKPLPVQAKNDLPFLDELPAEFGRSLPDLPINVFSYSSTPAERFVMIDMVKYVPGQRIKDQLELKEIRPDSIVVTYNGRTFKIKRP